MKKNHSIPLGFTERPATCDDIPIAVDLFNHFPQHYLGVNEVEVEDVQNEWTMPGFNPETDTRLVFSSDGSLAGYVEVWMDETPSVHPWVGGRVHPDFERRGIGLALLQHAFGEYYRRGYHSVSLGVDAENLTGALRLYEKSGMHVHRQFDLYEKELRPGKKN